MRDGRTQVLWVMGQHLGQWGASEAGLEEWIDFVIERLVSVPPPSMEDVEKTEPGEVAKSSLQGSRSLDVSLWAVGSQR